MVPGTGSGSGGTTVTITGTNFVSGATVTFGTAAATGVTVVNGTTITATTPAQPVGPVSVTVTNPNTKSGTLASGFTYTAPAPTVSFVTPSSGPAAGGTSITITGTGFVAGASVKIGGTSVSGVVVVNSTTITATTPAGATGAVSVVVTNPDTQTGTLTNGFTYLAPPPTVTNVAPGTGSTIGGTLITITGTNFVAGATVSIGGNAATGVTVVNATTITASTPAGAVGVVSVKVTNADGQSASLANAFTYDLTAPTISSVSPNTGLTTGSTAITITGTNYVAGASVNIGGSPATGVTVVNATTINASTPAHAAGAVNVTVTNPDTQLGTLTNGFTYQLPAPTVSSVSPSTGVTLGGTAITITGTNFVAGATVSVGGNAATGVNVANATTITATTPAHAAGAVNVTVTNPDTQAGTLTNGFTYQLPAPTVSSLTPTSGLTAGGTAITITGANFVAGATVSVGGNPATSVTVVNGTTITATTAAHAAGAVSVTVTNPDAQTGTLTNGYTYVLPAPTVTSVSPNTGLTTGGAAISITGNNFLTGATVSVGGNSATSVTVVNGTTITATTPAHAAGAINVTVTNPDAQIGTLTNGFTYVLPAPTLTSVTPGSGPTAGGTPITISGTNFVAGATVSVGGSPAAAVTVANATTITATTPAGAAGTANVTVTNPDAQSATLSNAFTYSLTAPTVSGVSPNAGLTTGGTAITITGTNFVAGATVSVGGSPASGVTFVNGTTISATTPAHAAGAVNVTVTNPDSQSGTLAAGFTYVLPAPTVSSVLPSTGLTTGGTAITITGTNFVSGATVSVGGNPAAGVTVVNGTSITATTAAHAAGAASVTVTNTDGQNATLTNSFTYVLPAPTVTNVSPNTGVTTGGTSITITGTNFVSGATVNVGGNAATSVTFVNGTTITATTAAHAAGAVNVSVTNPDAQTGTLTNGYTYVLPAPTVTSVSPNTGLTTGGAAISITGNNFLTGATVSVGGNPATSVTVVNGTTITATTPAHAAGAVNVTVTNPDTQTGTLTNGFTYQLPAPTVSNVSPNTGVTSGGTSVTITGANFVAGATVSVGGSPASGVTVVNSTTIAATTPAHVAGVVTIVITNPDNQSATLANAFTYQLPAPTISSVSPGVGVTTGGTGITITGSNFVTGAALTLGGSSASGVTVVSGTTITASTPVHAAGAVNVVVTNPDTQFATLVKGFTYQLPAPQVSSVSPNSGVVTGGTAITVTGANFVAGASVSIGGNPAAGVTVVSSSTITATTPAGAIGTVAVSVTNPDNQTGTLANGFIYTAVGAPTLASVAPGSGLRGTAVGVTLTGANFAATGNTVAVSGTGVTVSNVAALNSTTITATFTISASAAINARTVTVTTSSGTSNSQPFSVLGPVLSAITPNTGARGTSVPVTLTGTGLATATGVTVSGSNVTVSNFAAVDDGTVTATLTVGSGAGETARTVKVTTAASGSSNGVTFTVDLPPTPTLTSVTPNTGVRGTAVPVTLLGASFTATGTKITVSGSGVTVSNTTVVDSGTLTATFTISATASASARNVTVTTPGGTTSAVTFAVQGPTLTSVSPNPVTHGTGVVLTLTGTNLAGATGVTLGNLSDSCVVNNSTSTSVSATCTLVAGTTTVKAVTPIGTTGTVSLTVN